MTQSQEALQAFFTALPAANQAIVSLAAKTPFLKNPSVWLTGLRNPDQPNDPEGEQEDDEDLEQTGENTVVNGEDTRDRQEALHNDEDFGITPSPPWSP